MLTHPRGHGGHLQATANGSAAKERRRAFFMAIPDEEWTETELNNKTWKQWAIDEKSEIQKQHMCICII